MFFWVFIHIYFSSWSHITTCQLIGKMLLYYYVYNINYIILKRSIWILDIWKFLSSYIRIWVSQKAAKILHIAQPAVTRSIQDLENDYGVCLFDRLNHRLYRTPLADELYTRACYNSWLFGWIRQHNSDIMADAKY